ncbi:MAG: hypothetical protein JWP01_1186 [Myxococcales bacterium]|nr:hypothetical protein [Myxococcales bacterium]
MTSSQPTWVSRTAHRAPPPAADRCCERRISTARWTGPSVVLLRSSIQLSRTAPTVTTSAASGHRCAHVCTKVVVGPPLERDQIRSSPSDQQLTAVMHQPTWVSRTAHQPQIAAVSTASPPHNGAVHRSCCFVHLFSCHGLRRRSRPQPPAAIAVLTCARRSLSVRPSNLIWSGARPVISSSPR